MKKVIYLLVMAAAFVGCNPLDDLNDQVDALPEQPNIGEFEYTLTDADYSAFDLGFGSFNSQDQAKDSIPQLLSDLYPLYGQGSSVLVNYKLFVGAAEGVSAYTSAETYPLSNDDYALTGSDAFGFYPNVDPTALIPDVLDAQIAAPVEGQIALVTYKQYTETPDVGLAIVGGGNFPDIYPTFENVDVDMDGIGWSEGAAHANASAFVNGSEIAGEDWLVSPEIDLSGETDLKFQINQRISFLNGNEAADFVNILVSTNYTTGGDPIAATWDVITLTTVPSGNTSEFILSEDYDFSAYDDTVIHVAFRYNSTSTVAPLWRIDYFNIKTLGVTGNTDSKGEYFVYEGGSWNDAENVYYLSNADYDSMGESSGQPGAFNNFSSSTPADSYLPTFLDLKYPFAQEENKIIVIYKYFSSNSGAGIRGNEYTFTSGQWMAHESTIETSLKFGFDEGQWVPDNTIRYIIAQADIDYIATNYASADGFSAAVSSMANFGNFDRRSSNAAFWSVEMLNTVFTDLLTNFLAPNAEEGQKYVLTFDIYDGSSGTEELKYIKTGGVWVPNVD
ncbi:hypothetical protein ESY86_08630 [Subsaximicrobium wynnwilliamsii]|uniref:DUF5017 domain-containing protein n=1 Tax=Subsaximicrobium wynnwilliamsii TaxID=291179 RepID=A0A5C6ZLB8_9FLAO|nr:choice-of-anchor J domain-containing protein [Subsaximicrobium wynnwilliamsii]TXD83679.1 hypothetical protein ESY87_08575 [Subsaximicrobium wynnwilliamsii]TXD89437.1 hypothetical protein ESY86_08630 [Subsaximicrobium wynnwilliamsii]TXE03516.1 hypothetical protein ESY88_07600 [Subsaximicrobium wynnwilliamsii]